MMYTWCLIPHQYFPDEFPELKISSYQDSWILIKNSRTELEELLVNFWYLQWYVQKDVAPVKCSARIWSHLFAIDLGKVVDVFERRYEVDNQ